MRVFARIKSWFTNKALAVAVAVAAASLIAQTESTSGIDVASITSLVSTLIATILPILLIVMVIKVVTSLFKNLADAF